MIIYTSIQNISYSFVGVNLYPHSCLSFSEWIKKIAKIYMVETDCFRNHEGFYYNSMSYVWNKRIVIKLGEVICATDLFIAETPGGEYL